MAPGSDGVASDGANAPHRPGLQRADELSFVRQVAIYLTMMLVSLSYNYSFILIDYVRPYLVRDGIMSLEQTTLIYSSQAMGVIIGSFLVPTLIRRSGNKVTLLIASLIMTACTVVNDFSAHFMPWLISRFIVGVMLPGCYVTSITTLANVFPPRLRGRLLSINMAMFSVSLMTFGTLGALFGGKDWHILMRVSAAMPLIGAGLALVLVPDDRKLLVYANTDTADTGNEVGGRWSEMFAGSRRRLTIACIVLAGLNFSAYQFYSGFITTYLLTVRHFSNPLIGAVVAVDGVGTLVGTLIWGVIADRWGRKYNLLGFVLAAFCVGLFLSAPSVFPLLVVIELGYAIGLSCTNCWAAYFAELFCVRLRPMGTSLFHGGHVISLFAPLIVAAIAAHAPLAVGMALAPLSFVAAALIWSRLPETLKTGRRYRGFVPQ